MAWPSAPPTSLQPAILSNSLEAPCALPQTSQADSNLRAFALAIPADSSHMAHFLLSNALLWWEGSVRPSWPPYVKLHHTYTSLPILLPFPPQHVLPSNSLYIVCFTSISKCLSVFPIHKGSVFIMFTARFQAPQVVAASCRCSINHCWINE